MSDLDSSHDSSFSRGARIRTSLPIVRTQSKSKEKPLGAVFLVYRNETKRAVLPNEITCLDTVRALFVRSFAKAITFDFLEGDQRKIYIFDETKNIFYELENVTEVVDRSILKIQEFDSNGQPIQTFVNGNLTGCDVRHLLESRATPCPTQPPPSPQPRPYNTLHNGHQSRGTSPFGKGSTSQPHSPQRVPRTVPGLTVPASSLHHVTARSPTQSDTGPISHSSSCQSCPDQAGSRQPASGSSTPKYDDAGQRIAKMEVQLATLTAWVQQSAATPHDRPHSIISCASDTSHSSSSASHQTPPNSVAMRTSEISECSSATPTPMGNHDIQRALAKLHLKARHLGTEVRDLRKLQLKNTEMMREMIYETSKHLQRVISVVPGADEQPLRGERLHVNTLYKSYQYDSHKVERQLGDLESAVEDLRNDILNRKCRVIAGEVEAMALSLSQISRCLADFKNAFPLLMNRMKYVMAGEMEVVVNEEKFIREEPERIDLSLRRCKKITGVLFTLKKLGSVQETKSPNVPILHTNKSPKDIDKKAILENIQSIVPDHEARVQSMQAADALREKKKKITSCQEALKFEKSLELAHKGLKDSSEKPRERKYSDSKKEKDKSPNDAKAKEEKKLSEKELKKAEKEMKKLEKEKQKQLEKERKKAEKNKRKPSPNEKNRKSMDCEQVSLNNSSGGEPSDSTETKANLKELEENVANVQVPPSVERIRVPSGPVATAAPAPKLSSFAAPTSPYESFCSNYSRLLASNPKYEQIYCRPRTVIEAMYLSESPMTSRSDSPKSSTQENPYAVGRPRPASISGPISELDALYLQNRDEFMSMSTTAADDNHYEECSLATSEPLYAQITGKRKVPPPPPPRKYKANGQNGSAPSTEPNTPTTANGTPPGAKTANFFNNYENIEKVSPGYEQFQHNRSISEPAPNVDSKALQRFENDVMQGLFANIKAQKSSGAENTSPKTTMTMARHERHDPVRERRSSGDFGKQTEMDKAEQQRLVNVHLHEQYWKLQRLQQQHGKQDGQKNTGKTETSPIITRSKVVINNKTGRKEEETDIF